mmetsp:Transcript_146587/g.470299  ORF Transcript_146587/g.470299 Transcript_146587/m.470299 type:complete len:268 (+) Transcript_146587:272-1075(+)
MPPRNMISSTLGGVLSEALHQVFVLGADGLQVLLPLVLRRLVLGGLGLVPSLEGLALEGHRVGDGREHWVGLVELRREGLHHAAVVLRDLGVARRLGITPGLGGLGDFDGEEERQKVSDPEAAAARLHGLRLASGWVLLLRADALDELQEGRLLASSPLQHRRREDLHEQVVALHIHQDVVGNDLEIRGLAQVVTQQHVHVAVAAAHDPIESPSADSGWQGGCHLLARGIQVHDVAIVEDAHFLQGLHVLLSLGKVDLRILAQFFRG